MRRLSFLFLFVLGTTIAFAQQGDLKTKTFHLDNGLKVVMCEDHSQPEIYGAVYVHAGSTVYKLDRETGKTAGSCVVGMTPGYATLPMITGEGDDSGYVYAFGNGSRIFKIDKETMTVAGESALFPGQNMQEYILARIITRYQTAGFIHIYTMKQMVSHRATARV